MGLISIKCAIFSLGQVPLFLYLIVCLFAYNKTQIHDTCEKKKIGLKIRTI